jgi:hypothetical protein
VLSKDLIPILKDLNEAHRDSSVTSDKIFSNDEIIKVINATINTHGNGPVKLATIINALLKIGLNKKNIDKTEKFITKETLNESDWADFLNRSEIVEPDARKRRRKK